MSEKKVKQHEYFMMIGFCMIVFFGAMLDSESIIPAAGVMVGAVTAGVATWLYYRK